MFIDIHSHVLPGVDDGAETFNDACEIMQQAYASGTTVMTVTPHYNNISQCHKRLKKQEAVEKYRELKKAAAEKGIPVTLFLGSELLVDENIDYMFRHDEFITLNGSRYMLTEFAFDKDIKEVSSHIDSLLSYGIVPVIAHPERYNFFINNYSAIIDTVEKGCIFQINKGSPLGQYGPDSQETAIWMLNNDCVHVIASDCHSSTLRNSDMSDIYSWMLERFDRSRIIELMHDNPKRILLDQYF